MSKEDSGKEWAALNDIKVRVFFGKNIEKSTFCRHEKNCKSNVPVTNLIVDSRNMIKVSKHMSL